VTLGGLGRRLLGLVALSAILVSSSAARAQDDAGVPAPPPDEHGDETVGVQDADAAARARDEFQAGVAHFSAERYSEAIHSFQIAASIIPSADLWYNIARSYEELARTRSEPSDYEQAIAHYQRYLTARVDPPDRAVVEQQIANLTERLESIRASAHVVPTTGILHLRSDHDGASVLIDGREVGRTPMDADHELTPGVHELRAELEGFIPFVGQVTIDAGSTTSSRVELEPAHRYRAVHGERLLTWVAFGLAGASLAASIGVGVYAADQQSAALSPYDAVRLENARGISGWSDAALGATMGFAILGVILFFVEGNSIGTETLEGPE
jgi:tetratricopeptide (TPR) repeat protein